MWFPNMINLTPECFKACKISISLTKLASSTMIVSNLAIVFSKANDVKECTAENTTWAFLIKSSLTVSKLKSFDVY